MSDTTRNNWRDQMVLDVKAAAKERCRNLSFAIATSQDGGAIRDMKQRLAEAQAELTKIEALEAQPRSEVEESDQ